MSEAAARLRALFAATLARLDPAAATADTLGGLVLSGRRVWVIALGKAALGMAAGAHRVLGERLVGGAVVAPAAGPTPPNLALWVADHPTPTEASLAAGEAVLAAVRRVPAADHLLVCVSGGASALAAVPAAGLTLAEKRAAVDAVKDAGAPIQALNAVRKHLSAIKGGRLAAACAAPVTTLVASDVVGDQLSAVGSGPTVPDPTTFAEAWDIVERYTGWRRVPAAVRAHLERGRAGSVAETPKQARPGDVVRLVAGVGALARAAREVAGELAGDSGGEAEIVAEDLSGAVAAVAARIAADVRRSRRPRWLVYAGEPVIEVPADAGSGGRAQHLALELAGHLRGQEGVTVLVAGSDGMDGNTQAAGAIVDGTTWERIAAQGREPSAALARCDSGTALREVGAVVVTGRTGVNHCDLVVVTME